MRPCRRSRGIAPYASGYGSVLPVVVCFLGAVQLLLVTLEARGEPTYVDDATCGRCHDEIWRSYQDVGMARSFASGEAAERIEIWTGEGSRFFHRPSGRWYEMKLSREGRPVFARWQVDENGEEIHRWERDVDWVLGSGHTSRSYLVHLPGGELFVLPVAWYTQENRWDMAPGFEAGDHLGLGRRVRRECMFCHNAYPSLAATPDDVGEPHAFPFELPHGTGCQRCHGPGSEHVDAAIFGGLPGTVRGTVRGEIVNPGRLDPMLRDDVCRQCHMQPAVSLLPTRRFGRPTYSYRPGEPIDEYLVFFDPEVDPASLEATDGVRFEINHHPYRLEKSRCWTESRGRPDALSCLTCHDPHRKVPPAERAAHYREACLSCHQLEACDLQRMGDAVRAELPPARRGVAAGNCVGCHMPRRRTRDVIHVVMTDHEIQARPGGAELTAPIEKSQPVILDLELLYPERDPQGPLAEVYRALGAVRAGSGADSGVAEHFERNLRRAGSEMPEPWLELGKVQLRFGRTDEALRSFRRSRDVMEEGHPLLPDLLASTGVAAVHQRRIDEAITALRASLAAEPGQPDVHFDLGSILLATAGPEEALGPLHRAVGLRPLFPDAWFHLGVALQRLERPAEAAEAWRMALSVDPSHGKVAMALGRLLVEGGEREEALRILRHAARWADDPAPVRVVLEEVVPEETEETEEREEPAESEAESQVATD